MPIFTALSMTFLALLPPLSLQTARSDASAILDAYIRALGGEQALRAIRTRTTEGTFDNGRGLRTRFRTVEKAPNKRLIVIGSRPLDAEDGSGRAYDGVSGWDKNFVGTGLRTLAGAELASFAAESSLARPLSFATACRRLEILSASDSEAVVNCALPDGRAERLRFNTRSGLLVEQVSEREIAGTATVRYDDYRAVDGVRLPFQTRITLPNAEIRYVVDRVQQNQPVDDAVFARPR
jgi:hypothetical protein